MKMPINNKCEIDCYYNYLFIKKLNETWLKFSILTDEIITDMNGKKINNNKIIKIILEHFNEKTLKSIIINHKLKDKLLYIIIRLYLKNYKSILVDINHFSKNKIPKNSIIINNNYKKIYSFINNQFINIFSKKTEKIKLENLLFLIPKRTKNINNNK